MGRKIVKAIDNEAAKKAVIWTRVSSREQEEGYSLDAQKDRSTTYCRAKGLEILAVFEIVESSTRGTREQFYEMINFVKRQKSCIALVCDKVDRLQRSFREVPVLEELRKSRKIELHFVTEGQMLNAKSNSSQIMSYQCFVMMAESYTNNISDNVCRSLEEMRKKGKWAHHAPVGYKNVRDANGNSDIVLDEDNHFIITRLFKEFSIGTYNLEQITRKFYYDEICSPNRKEDMSWIKFFNEKINDHISGEYYNTYPRGIFFYKLKDMKNFYVMSFGLGRGGFINKNKIVFDFGIKVAMNICDPDGLRRVQSSKVEAIALHSEKQINSGARLSIFDIDDEKEFLRKIATKPLPQYSYISVITGSEAVQVKFGKEKKLDWDNLGKITKELSELYFSQKYKDISGGVINVKGGVGLGSSANDIYDNGNVIFGTSIKLRGDATLDIKEGATLFAYENYKIDEPDLDNSDLDVVTFGNKATITMNDNTSKINLAGTLSANINGDDRGKIHFQNSGAQIDGDVEAASLIFEDSHTLSKAVTSTVGGLDIFEIKKGPYQPLPSEDLASWAPQTSDTEGIKAFMKRMLEL